MLYAWIAQRGHLTSKRGGHHTSYGDLVTRYLAHHKPVIIGEFGCCTYQGAEDVGGRGWAIVDQENPLQLNGTYVRNDPGRALSEQGGRD